MKEIKILKKTLSTKFEVKNLEQVRYFLEMKVAISKGRISVSQQKYVLNVLTKTSMLKYKPSGTLIGT